MNNQGQVRVGIVGCGYEGRLMAEAIARVSRLRVTACADPVEEAAASVAALAGTAEVHSSAEDLISSGSVDAVVLATPHHVLHEIALAAIDAGMHVLAEKPIAMNEREAAAIEEAVAQTDLCYMSGYSLRFFVAQQLVHELLTAGAVGEILAVTAGMGSQSFGGWAAEAESGGGPLLFYGSHVVDEILWFVRDEPVEVYAEVRYGTDSETEETSVFQIRFSGGAVAQCVVTQAASAWFDFVHIYGRDGRLGLEASQWLRYAISVSSNTLPAYAQPTTIRPRLTREPLMMMLVPEVEEFAAAVLEDREPAITTRDGRQVLRVLDAVVASGQMGKPIGLM